MKTKKRRNTKINKSFMTNYLKVLFILSFAVICVLFVAHHHTLTQAKAMLMHSAPNSTAYAEVLDLQALLFYKIMIATMMCFFVSVCIMTKNLTTQVTKPVESLISHLEKLPDITQARKIRFKKGDTFEELMKAFNFLVQRQTYQREKAPLHNYNTLKN